MTAPCHGTKITSRTDVADVGSRLVSCKMSQAVVLIAGAELASYGFPSGHPFGPDRYGAFMAELERSAVAAGLTRKGPRQATRAELEYFHTPRYVDRVIELSARGS